MTDSQPKSSKCGALRRAPAGPSNQSRYFFPVAFVIYDEGAH